MKRARIEISIDHVPNEILEMILSRVEQRAAVRLVCRRWAFLMPPHMYTLNDYMSSVGLVRFCLGLPAPTYFFTRVLDRMIQDSPFPVWKELSRHFNPTRYCWAVRRALAADDADMLECLVENKAIRAWSKNMWFDTDFMNMCMAKKKKRCVQYLVDRKLVRPQLVHVVDCALCGHSELAHYLAGAMRTLNDIVLTISSPYRYAKQNFRVPKSNRLWRELMERYNRENTVYRPCTIKEQEPYFRVFSLHGVIQTTRRSVIEYEKTI